VAIWTTIACAGLVCGLLVAEHKEHALLKAVTKISASLAFIATGLLHDGLGRGAFGQWVVAALVLGAVGDAALLSKEQKPFLLGIVAFLLSHVAYIGAFVVLGVSPVGAVGALLLLVPIAALVRRWIGDGAGELGRAVTAYVVVITAMVACAAGALVAAPDLQRGVLLGAAVLFFVSDLCVARERFVTPGIANRVVGLPLYYAAQLAFAWSLALSAAA
jgi:uncharacterized membrane protein YhhN